MANGACACSRPGVRKKRGDWICQRCLDLEEPVTARLVKAKKEGVRQNQGKGGTMGKKAIDLPHQICGGSLDLLTV